MTTKILLPEMFLRGDTKQHSKLRSLTDIVFERQDAKRDRAPRWRWIVGGFFESPHSIKGCKLTLQPARENADRAFLVDSILLYFPFFCIPAGCPSRFLVKFVAGLATTCTVKENFLSRKGGFFWTKNDGDAHPWPSDSVKCTKKRNNINKIRSHGFENGGDSEAGKKAQRQQHRDQRLVNLGDGRYAGS